MLLTTHTLFVTGKDLPEDERPMPEDTPEITKAKEEKAKARKEKIEKDKEERKKKLKNGDTDPGELQMCVIYHPFLWLQSFLSGYMSEVEGKGWIYVSCGWMFVVPSVIYSHTL